MKLLQNKTIMESDKCVIRFDQICRICLCEKYDMKPLFIHSDKNVLFTLQCKFESCLKLQISEEDGMPAQICFTCVEKIEQAFELQQQCQKSDNILRELLSLEKPPKNELISTNVYVQFDRICENSTLVENIFSKNTTDFNTDEHSIPEDKPTIQFQCGICCNIFTSNTDLEKHSIIHDNLKTYKCDKCTKHFTKLNYLQRHKHSHNLKKNVCKFCAKSFKTLQAFTMHTCEHIKKSNSVENIPIEKRFQCPKCDKSYTSAANLTIHSYWHTGERPYKCEHCNRGFTKSAALSSHLVLHTGQRSHLCSECGRGFTSATILNQHRRTHTGEKPYKCTTCERRFNASGDLRVHMRSHTGEKPYLCQVCGRAFSRTTHLNTHSRIHTGERPYTCVECGRSFAQSGDLRAHTRTHTGERPYVCSTCGKRFVQSSGLASHKATHSGLKTHFCKICNRAFAQSSSLVRHFKSHIGKDINNK